MNTYLYLRSFSLIVFFLLNTVADAQKNRIGSIETSEFYDSAHHWYDINDEVHKAFKPDSNQKRYATTQIAEIADNILLYQKSNGGWDKNYDMLAILTDAQKSILRSTVNDISLTTFDNGATHSQIKYLVEAYSIVNNERYKEACLRGLDFILSAQYSNGGFPQFFPDTSGYRKYITFNDGAMGGVLKVLHNIVRNKPEYSFVDQVRRKKIERAFNRGIDCVVKCQIRVNDILTAWCQQHDNIDLRPRNARTFEPAAICSQESADIVLFLMSIKQPSTDVVNAVNGATAWFLRSQIHGIRVEIVKAKKTEYMYHTTDVDKIVVNDSTALPIWSRMYEIETNRPLFCNRDGNVVYSLAEVERERRTGYQWYNYEPDEVFKKYLQWQKKWSPDKNVLNKN